MSNALLGCLNRAWALRAVLGLIALLAVAGFAVGPASAAQFTQQDKLVGAGMVGNAQQGRSVALSGDGDTALVGGPVDNSFAGAAWVFVRGGGVWRPPM